MLLNALLCGSLLLLTFLILTRAKDENRSANNWLGLFLLSVTFVSLDSCFIDFDMYAWLPHIVGISDLFFFVMAPAFYFSVRYFTAPQDLLLRRKWLHFIPMVLFFILQVPFYLERAAVNIADSTAPVNTNVIDVVFLVLVAQIGIYLTLSLRRLHQHQHNVQLFASTVEKVDLRWLQHTAYGIVFLFLVWIVEYMVPIFADFSVGSYLAGVFYLAYFALQQPSVFPFSEKIKEEIAEIMEEVNAPKTEKRKLFSEVDLALQKECLLNLMETEKPFLENELSLPSLSQRLHLSTNELSYLLNEGFSENFFQFINRYRIEESKRLLTSPAHAHLSMVGIAYEAGFNSKTVFNTNFKKVTGVAPTEFRQSAVGSKQ